MLNNQSLKGLVGLILFMCIWDGIDGVCDVSSCIDPDVCTLSPSGQSCICAVGFYGDLCDKAAVINVICEKDFITIMVNEDFFSYYHVAVESLHLPNKTCRAQRELVAGTLYYVVRTPIDDYANCGGKPLERNITHIAYSLTLMSDPQTRENIVRDPTIRVEYKCIHPYVQTVSLPFHIIPFSSETLIRVDQLEAKVEMSLFKDHAFTEAFTSAPTFHLRDKMFVQVRVTEPEDVFHLRVNDCWATQTRHPNDSMGITHPLLLNGCVSDETAAFHNETEDQMGRNGVGSTFRYNFDMFRFASEPNGFYLHCTVRLCSPGGGEICIPECSAGVMGEESGEHPAQALLSYGPIRIDVAESPKFSLLLTLVFPVCVIWVLGAFLLILISLAKAGNKRLSRPSVT